MSISGKNPSEVSDEEVYIDEEDIIQEIPIEEEGRSPAPVPSSQSPAFLVLTMFWHWFVQIFLTVTTRTMMAMTMKWVCIFGWLFDMVICNDWASCCELRPSILRESGADYVFVWYGGS